MPDMGKSKDVTLYHRRPGPMGWELAGVINPVIDSDGGAQNTSRHGLLIKFLLSSLLTSHSLVAPRPHRPLPYASQPESISPPQPQPPLTNPLPLNAITISKRK